MKKEINKFYAYKFLLGTLFFLPIVIIYFKSTGLSFMEIFLLQSIGALCQLILEVPTGAIADYFGKKTSTVTGIFVLALACLTFFAGSSFVVFAIAYFIWALGWTMRSGADTALLYDILHVNKKDPEFKKYRGTTRVFALTGTAIGSILGGFIAAYSLRMTYFVTAAVMIICAFIVMSIKHKEEKRAEKDSYIQILRDSFNIIKNEKMILWLFLLTAAAETLIKIFRPASQIYMEQAALPIAFFGIASAYFFIVGASSSKLAHGFEKKLSKWSYVVLGGAAILGVFLISSFVFKLGFIIFGLFFFSRAIISIIAEHEALKLTPKSRHSTVLSFSNMMFRGISALCYPIFGHYIDVSGFQKTVFGVGIVLLILVPAFVVSYILIKKK